jgi:hypothetical protein
VYAPHAQPICTCIRDHVYFSVQVEHSIQLLEDNVRQLVQMVHIR